MPIREAAKRREDFDEERSHPVVLSDGQVWHLPKPWVAIHPIFQGGKPVDNWKCFTYGRDLDALVEGIAAAEGTVESVMAGVALAAYLLRRNYDLSDDELAQVLVYRSGEPESIEMLKSVFDTAVGRTGPKPSRGGGG